MDENERCICCGITGQPLHRQMCADCDVGVTILDIARKCCEEAAYVAIPAEEVTDGA